ncbi:copper transporter [Planomonospora sp. ID67723]|uniref:copper transporter n=1 Tax=Planomonospora sp. ID67723 TaxID=2738134 RepID=UPI0018C35DFF|nr:copper transporter [Planomonospora sp. ID67723]MBG0832838.1 copper transporter [Planomonospora sp. ID67723]
MIDFRYHLVSIVAIFLALSVGIVLGTTLLEEPALQATEAVADTLQKGNSELRAELDTLRKRDAGNDAFVTAHAAELARGVLAGESVVIVEAPGAAAATTEAVRQSIEQSGATVTGQVTLTDKYVDPAQSVFVDRLATGIKPVDMVFPAEDTPYDKAAAVLAGALVTVLPDQAAKENAAAAGVIDAFQRAELLTVAAEPNGQGGEPGQLARAGLAVLVAPAEPYTGESAATQAGAIVSMALGLDEGSRGGVLVGSQSAAAVGGVVAALRESVAEEKVSSVDTLDTPAGRLVVVYALREQLSGITGQYGTGPGASAFEPSVPVPTASPSPPTATPGG